MIIENREGSPKWIIVCKKRVKVPLSAHNVFATSELLYHVKKSREEEDSAPMELLCECCWNTVPKPQPPNNFWMRAKNSDFLTRLPAYGATPQYHYFSIVVTWEPTGNESMGAWDTEKSWLKDELMTTTASSSSDIIRRQFFDETHQQKFLGYPPFTT